MYRRRSETDAVLRLSDNAIFGPEREEDWQTYQAWLAAGNEPEPADELTSTQPIPFEIALRQARAILAQRGLLDQANAAVEAANDPTLSAIWEYGNNIRRASPALIRLAAELNLGDPQVDALFVAAAELTA